MDRSRTGSAHLKPERSVRKEPRSLSQTRKDTPSSPEAALAEEGLDERRGERGLLDRAAGQEDQRQPLLRRLEVEQRAVRLADGRPLEPGVSGAFGVPGEVRTALGDAAAAGQDVEVREAADGPG